MFMFGMVSFTTSYPPTDSLFSRSLTMLTRIPGERTPVRVRMSEAPASIPARWQLCKTARQFRAAVASNMDPSNVQDIPVRRVVERADGSVVEGEW